jgi:hypothetical protein
MFKLSILILPLALFSIQVRPGQAQERTATVSGVVTLNGKDELPFLVAPAMI